MKICTITCHDVYNHGASLQAYALLTYLQNCGHDVEIIDYKPDYLSNHYNLWSIDNPVWNRNLITRTVYITLKFPMRLRSLRRKKAFDEFRKKNLITTNRQYYSNEELKVNLPKAEAFICGSDQIWNSLHQNGKDPAFYLDFVPDEKIKSSYAASFATDTISEVLKPIVKKRLERLDGVGVREKSGVEIIKDLNINHALNVVDPVFLLEEEKWNKIGNLKIKEKYILVYDFDNSQLIKKIAQEMSVAKGYAIYAINPMKLKYADKYFTNAGPETFVSLVRNAQFVISNSYHAAVFSIIYERNFVIVNRQEAINTRMRDLLDDLELSYRLLNKDFDKYLLQEQIEYKRVKEILLNKIENSKKYLAEVLSIESKERNYNEEVIVRH